MVATEYIVVIDWNMLGTAVCQDLKFIITEEHFDLRGYNRIMALRNDQHVTMTNNWNSLKNGNSPMPGSNEPTEKSNIIFKHFVDKIKLSLNAHSVRLHLPKVCSTMVSSITSSWACWRYAWSSIDNHYMTFVMCLSIPLFQSPIPNYNSIVFLVSVV
jgi:hypothetical protein